MTLFFFDDIIRKEIGDEMAKELLLPAGNMEALKMAIHNGADAVYLGGKKFGARAFAPNFSEEELSLATQYCHLYGVKIYVTVNTMIFERELNEVLEYVTFLYQTNIDAVIVSDIGLIHEIHKKYPDFPIHLSTQAHTFSAQQMSFFKELGVTRVVLDRELSLEEINTLPDILELEVFIHGALCVAYSGQCLFSFMKNKRSGNRGSCAQLCRMPYELFYYDEKMETSGKYLLSTKELNTSARFKELLESKITSFKIEGRMKSPEYVGFLANFYKKLMLEYQNDKTCTVLHEQEKELNYLFNREFTEGYLFQKDDIMNFKTSNHQGNVIGKVLETTKDKIKIKLTENLSQEDGIRFEASEKGMMVNFLYNEKGLLTHEAHKGDLVFVDNKVALQKEDIVRKTIDKKLMDSLKCVTEKKIPISIEVNASFPTVSIMVNDGKYHVEIAKEIAEISQKIRMSKEDIEKQIKKLGNTPFCCEKIHISLNGNLFIPNAKLNELRREALDVLIEKRISNPRKGQNNDKY